MVDTTEGYPEAQPGSEQKTDLDTLADVASLNKFLATEHNPLSGALVALARATRLHALITGVSPPTVSIDGKAFRFTSIDATTGLGVASTTLTTDLNKVWAAAVEKIRQQGSLAGTPSGTGMFGVKCGLLSATSGTFVTNTLYALSSDGALITYAGGNLPPIAIGINATTAYVDLGGRIQADGITTTFNANGKIETMESGVEGQPFLIESPSDEEDFGLLRCRATAGITLKEFDITLVGASSPEVQFNIFFGPDRSLTGTFVASNGFTATNLTGGQIFNTFSNAAIPSGNAVWLETTVKTGVVTAIEGVTRYEGKI